MEKDDIKETLSAGIIPYADAHLIKKLSFMEMHIPMFLQRFSLSYARDCSCLEYFLHSKEKGMDISRELIISQDSFSLALHVSKFYPEIFREPLPKYMSAVCFFLMINHAASLFKIHRDTFIFIETRRDVFQRFYSRLKDFDFGILHRRSSENYAIKGTYHICGPLSGISISIKETPAVTN
ncbi:MAG: hypothetical protein HQK66_04785 [Desulfamplus sp.]|nr:hypothetical protein [Desulfamplus sp.]